MQSFKRQEFLSAFLDLLGISKIEWGYCNIDNISGTVTFDLDYPDEKEDFCWKISEANVPSNKVIDLIHVIKENNFIDVDRITVPLPELFKKTNEQNYEEFMATVEELLTVEIPRVENGEEVDAFFVHLSNFS